MLFVYHRDLLYCVLDCVVLIFVGCWYLFRQTKLVSIEVLMNWQDIREKQIYQKWQDWRNEYDTSMEWPSRDTLKVQSENPNIFCLWVQETQRAKLAMVIYSWGREEWTLTLPILIWSYINLFIFSFQLI